MSTTNIAKCQSCGQEMRPNDYYDRLRAINAELVAALQTCASNSAMPASNQESHPISENEFRARLLGIGRVARAAITKAGAQ